MSALNAIRNVLAASAALVGWFLAARLLAPLAAPHLPGVDAVTAVLGASALLAPVVHKLMVDALATLRVGSAPPARSHIVSIVAGAAVLAFVSGAGAFIIAWLLEQAAVAVRGAPAAQALVRTGVLHLAWVKVMAEMMGALFIGSWIGRRHGRASITPTVIGFALLGWAMSLAVDVLGGARSEETVRSGFHTLAQGLGHGLYALLPAASDVDLPLVAGAILVGLLGAFASTGRRTGGAGGRGSALVLGGVA